MTTRGFTLLEILIATVIMAFISVFTARMIQQGVRARKKIDDRIDRTTALHDALALMRQDIEKAFNYHDINIELFNEAQRERQQTTQQPPAMNPNQPNTALPNQPQQQAAMNPQQYALKQEPIYTRFMGEHDKLNFTSLNNYRSKRDIQESDQCEVGYYVAKCTSLEDPDANIECLWRRVSPYIDDDVTEGGHSTPILEDVKSLKFRYLGVGHEKEWVDSWNSVDGEQVMKGHFPMAVEATITIYDRHTDPPREVAMTIVASPHFLNDLPPNQQNPNMPGQPGLPGQPGMPGTMPGMPGMPGTMPGMPPGTGGM